MLLSHGCAKLSYGIYAACAFKIVAKHKLACSHRNTHCTEAQHSTALTACIANVPVATGDGQHLEVDA